MLDALEQYRILAAKDDGAILPEIDEPVKPGGRYDGIPRLIRLLQMTLRPGSAVGKNSTYAHTSCLLVVAATGESL